MTLTLRIRNVESLENGMPVEFVLHRRGAVIGRSPTCDWSLPDPLNHISFRHCEIGFSDNGYVVTDISTNGTFVNGSHERLPGQHRIAHGDVLEIGHYEVTASLSGSAAMDEEPAGTGGAQQAMTGDAGWYGGGEAAAGGSGAWAPQSGRDGAAAGDGFGWGTPPSSPDQTAPTGSGWAPSHRAPDIAAGSTWEAEPVRPDPASGWSSEAPDRPPPPRTEDIWGRIAEGNVVDWARGGFGQPREPAGDPLGIAQPQPADWLPSERPGRRAAEPEYDASPPPDAAQQPTRPGGRAAAERPAATGAAPAPATGAEPLLAAILSAAGLDREEIKGPPQDAAVRIGALLRRLTAGLVVMVEARTRAKSQMGAETTSLQFDGNNPIKFARTPEQALAQLINPPERGFMEAERSVEDAFFDLQSHQMATLKAMQGALKATLDRFSPASIQARAGNRGALGSILTMARKAAFWDSYEREFSGVAHGSDEAFMDVFAKEFRKAYEEQSRQQARR